MVVYTRDVEMREQSPGYLTGALFIDKNEFEVRAYRATIVKDMVVPWHDLDVWPEYEFDALLNDVYFNGNPCLYPVRGFEGEYMILVIPKVAGVEAA